MKKEENKEVFDELDDTPQVNLDEDIDYDYEDGQYGEQE